MSTPHTSNTLPRRVVVTGMSGITSLGQDWVNIEAALRASGGNQAQAARALGMTARQLSYRLRVRQRVPLG